MTGFAALLKATVVLYLDALRRASVGLVYNWPIIAGSVALSVAFFLLAAGLGQIPGFGMAGGFILGLAVVAFISLYYSWLAATVNKERLSFHDLLSFDQGLFSDVMSVAFILFVVDLLLQLMIPGRQGDAIRYCVQLALFVLFNAIPEEIYRNRQQGTYALGQAARFVRENWIEWFLPLLVLLSPMLLVSPAAVLRQLGAGDPLLPGFVAVRQVLFFSGGGHLASFALALVLGTIVGNWFMLFRGFLFKELESSTRRKRAFRAR